MSQATIDGVAPGRGANPPAALVPVTRTAPPPAIGIGVVGPLQVLRSGRNVTPTSPKLRQLLTLLVTFAGEVVRQETIVEELWEAAPSERTTRTVQTYVSQLRKLLAAPPVDGLRRPVTITHTPRVGYRLCLAPGSFLDLARIRTLREAADRRDGPAGVAALRSALALCRGPVFSDVKLGPVLAEHRARLEADRLGVLYRYVRAQLDMGDPRAVLEEAGRIVVEGARHEELYSGLMQALADVGQHTLAVDLFHRARIQLAERDGVEPGPLLHAAFRRVSGGAAAPARRAGPSAPASAHPRTAAPPAQLPLAPSTFVGFRAQTATAVAALTPAPDVAPTGQRGRPVRPAVLAVVGGPGAGTSAFCARVADLVSAHYPDGQLYTDLADGVDGALEGFLRALRAPAVPDGLHERVRLFRALTRGRRLLVLADNVRGADADAALTPGSASSALVLASAVRQAADRRSTVVELPRLTGAEQMALLSLRLGAERVAHDPVATRALLDRCRGLPLAVTVAAERALMRPHWTVARLAAASVLACGDLDLTASVRRALTLLDAETSADLRRFAAEGAEGPVSVGQVAAALGHPVDRAEQMLERLVEIRMADPDLGQPDAADPRDYRYRIDPLYLEVVRAL